MEVFELSKEFPKEEKFSLTDQVRRSSRAVSAAIAESYGKRRYPKHFLSKLTDSDSENCETQCWLEFAHASGYIDKVEFDRLINESIEIGRLLNYMMNHPEKFGVQNI